MATTTSFPKPAGPFTADRVNTAATKALESPAAEATFDPLPLLDHHTLIRTIQDTTVEIAAPRMPIAGNPACPKIRT